MSLRVCRFARRPEAPAPNPLAIASAQSDSRHRARSLSLRTTCESAERLGFAPARRAKRKRTRCKYGGAVLIAVLLFSEPTVAKLASHAISPEEVRQVNDGDRIVIPTAIAS